MISDEQILKAVHPELHIHLKPGDLVREQTLISARNVLKLRNEVMPHHYDLAALNAALEIYDSLSSTLVETRTQRVARIQNIVLDAMCKVTA